MLAVKNKGVRAIFGPGGGGGLGGAVNHLPKNFLQVAQIFTNRSNRNEGNNIGRTGIWKWLDTGSISLNYEKNHIFFKKNLSSGLKIIH